jgi:hypothetical protein
MNGSRSQNESSAVAMTALLFIQVVVGYEWLVSGLTKIARGDFPSGLAHELAETSTHASAGYQHFLTSIVIPHASAFGYAIESAELMAGLLLLATAALLLASPRRQTNAVQQIAYLAGGLAVLVGLVLAVNFELLNGDGFGLRLAADSFDEGIDLDTIMIGLQLALLAFFFTAVSSRPRRKSGDVAAVSEPSRRRRRPRRSRG